MRKLSPAPLPTKGTNMIILPMSPPRQVDRDSVVVCVVLWEAWCFQSLLRFVHFPRSRLSLAARSSVAIVSCTSRIATQAACFLTEKYDGVNYWISTGKPYIVLNFELQYYAADYKKKVFSYRSSTVVIVLGPFLSYNFRPTDMRFLVVWSRRIYPTCDHHLGFSQGPPRARGSIKVDPGPVE